MISHEVFMQYLTSSITSTSDFAMSEMYVGTPLLTT